jgi:hypothetical protein
VQLPDGQDRSAQINGARAVPLLSAALCLTRVGPPPATLFFLPPFPCCHVSSTHLLLGGPRGSPFSHHPLISCRVYHALSTSVHHPKTSSFSCLLPIYLDDFRRGSPPVPPSAITLLLRAPITPRPPRWPSCPSLKISSYSRWQREKSSESRSAELAGPLSIPRSSY